jgi:hypothetical protein
MSSSSLWVRLDDDDEDGNMPDAIDELQHSQKAKDNFLKYLKEEVFKLNFYRAHMLYFIVVICITSVIVYGESLANGPREVGGSHLTYTDALFLCCSAMTTTGQWQHVPARDHRY